MRDGKRRRRRKNSQFQEQGNEEKEEKKEKMRLEKMGRRNAQKLYEGDRRRDGKDLEDQDRLV